MKSQRIKLTSPEAFMAAFNRYQNDQDDEGQKSANLPHYFQDFIDKSQV